MKTKKSANARCQQAFQMYEQGHTYNAIAVRLGVTPGAVAKMIWRVRNPDKDKAYAIKYARTKGIRPRSSLNHSDEIIRKVCEAHDAGLSMTQVARRFGFKTKNVVAGIVHRRPESKGVPV